MAFIETRELNLRHGNKTILEAIDLSIERGEFFALIGPTGAGKTSLLRLLDLLELPSSGVIAIDGAEVSSSPRERLAVRRRMAFVQQKPASFNMSLFDNVASGLRWRHVPGVEVRRRVKEVIELVGLAGKEAQHARTLSGGEMQRAAIARALVTEPAILFLDEPTANLDPVTHNKIEEVLAHIIREAMMTVVMATHDMSQGQRLAQRVGVLMDGHLLQVGSSRDIFTRPESRQVAEFVGVENIWPGVVAKRETNVVSIRVDNHTMQAVADFEVNEAVDVLIRPEEITLTLAHDITSARNAFTGRITQITEVGPLARLELDCGFPVLVLVTRKSAEELGLEVGKTVYASFKATSLRVIKRWL